MDDDERDVTQWSLRSERRRTDFDTSTAVPSSTTEHKLLNPLVRSNFLARIPGIVCSPPCPEHFLQFLRKSMREGWCDEYAAKLSTRYVHELAELADGTGTESLHPNQGKLLSSHLSITYCEMQARAVR